MTVLRSACLLLLLLPASLGVAACGGGSESEVEIDPGAIEEGIEDGMQDQLDLTMRVDCPAEIEPGRENDFSCTATSADDDEFEVDVVQTDDEGNVDWDVEVLPTGPIERSIAEEIFSQRAIRVTLDCPVAVPLEEDHEFECEAEDDQGRTQPIYATVTDEDGNVSWKT